MRVEYLHGIQDENPKKSDELGENFLLIRNFPHG